MAAGFRGWWIVAVAFVAQIAAIGFSIVTYPLFVDAIREEFGISLMTFNVGVVVLFVVMPIAGVVVGPVLDRLSIRAVMAGGAVLLASSLMLMSRATQVWQLGALLALGVAPAVAMMGPLAATTVVAKWFERQRGLAVGIASMGPLAGGLLLAYPSSLLIGSLGWRATLVWFAIATLLVVPIIVLVIRNRPEDIGQVVDGGPGDASASHGSAMPPARSTGEILSARDFWVLALAIGMVFAFITGWSGNVAQYAEDLGHDLQRSSLLMLAGAAVGIPGTFVFGWLADRHEHRILLWIAIAMQIGAFALLRARPPFGVMLAASAILGCSGGGLMPVYASLLARIFGPASIGNAMGLAGLVMLPFGIAAPLAIGRLRDTSGSFDSALLLVIGVFCLSAAVLALLPRRHILV